MDQISVFDMAKEVTLIKNLKLSEHLHSSLVIKYGKVYIKQTSKSESFQDPSHWLYRPPSYS